MHSLFIGRFFLRFVIAVTVFTAWPTFAEEPLPQLERLKTSPVLRHLQANPTSGAPPVSSQAAAGPDASRAQAAGKSGKSDAQKTTAQMFVPEGFRVEVIASEPEVQQPVAFAWDERGRLWVVEAYSYPQKRPAGEGLDRERWFFQMRTVMAVLRRERCLPKG